MYRPTAELHDQAGFFGNRDKIIGHDHAQFRIVPTCQRLESEYFPSRQIDHRLIAQGQAIPRQRIAQPAFQKEALPRSAQFASAIYLETSALFGGARGCLRLPDKLVGVSFVCWR